MEPALGVALLWLVFGGLHVGLATGRVRAALVARFGVWGFTALFSVVAAVAFTLLVRFYAAHRLDGAPGPGLGDVAGLRWALMATIVAGVMLTAASLVAYPRSPMALLGGAVLPPRGIERISRHSFFAGVTLVALAHVLLATRLVGAVFAAGFVLLATLGAWHQDRKLLALRGRPYADYLAVTSAVPLAAVLAGRQRIAWRELPLGALLLGAVLALALRHVHEGIFSSGGAWFIGVTVGGAAVLALQAWRRGRRVHPGAGGSTLRPRELHQSP
jgi:uncharacterized membrane protein